jgi:hypothetical protein
MSTYSYDNASQRYRNLETGRFIPKSQVDALINKRISLIQSDILSIGSLLQNDRLSLESWQQTTAYTIRELHLQSYMLARGGKAQMTPEDYLVVGRELKKQYRYLRAFAEDINRGYSIDKNGNQIPMTVGRFEARLKLYAKSGRAAAILAEEQVQRKSGMVAMSRHLGATDRHCESCMIYASAGVQPIGALPMPCQQCECGNRCLCSVRWYGTADLQRIAESA